MDAIEIERKYRGIIDSLPLITVWLQVRVRSEPTTKSIVGQSIVCGRGGSASFAPSIGWGNLKSEECDAMGGQREQC